ncbi:hypothetical protein M8494_18595 [Serratia ureilytica]
MTAASNGWESLVLPRRARLSTLRRSGASRRGTFSATARGGWRRSAKRGCSLQRRNQEKWWRNPGATPAGGDPPGGAAAGGGGAGRVLNYHSAGFRGAPFTTPRGSFYFLEVNTAYGSSTGHRDGHRPGSDRMHAAGGGGVMRWIGRRAATRAQGAAIEVRLYAEDPLKNFQPSRRADQVHFPADVHSTVGWRPAASLGVLTR